MAYDKTVEVKAGGKSLGHITFTQYESIEEAVSEYGAQKCLAAVNLAVKTAESTKIRLKHAPKTPEAQILGLMRAMKKGTVARDTATAKIRELASALQA